MLNTIKNIILIKSIIEAVPFVITSGYLVYDVTEKNEIFKEIKNSLLVPKNCFFCKKIDRWQIYLKLGVSNYYY